MWGDISLGDFTLEKMLHHWGADRGYQVYIRKEKNKLAIRFLFGFWLNSFLALIAHQMDI